MQSMVAPNPEPLHRGEFDAATLMRQYPPVLRSPIKLVVFRTACPDGTAGGHVSYSRWPETSPPATVDPGRAAGRLAVRDGFYDYEPFGTEPALEWHVNFADPRLFYAYGSSLFAQDEMQVAEHPVLGSLREVLVAERRSTLTVENGRPTPVLVMGAERRVRIATDRSATEGRPYGLYGNAFADAAADAVRRAMTVIDPPTASNIIAVAAPAGGYGKYRKDQIELVLATAYSGFRTAVFESRRATGSAAGVIVHSGFWGCGAFGGNRVMMTLLQALAADMAGVDRLVLHIGDPLGRAPVDQAGALLRDVLTEPGPIGMAALVSRIESLGLEWGHSDGN